MEFCLGCGSDLPSESRYVRRLVAERSDLSRLRSGVVLAWRNLMKEALEENSGPSLCSGFHLGGGERGHLPPLGF